METQFWSKFYKTKCWCDLKIDTQVKKLKDSADERTDTQLYGTSPSVGTMYIKGVEIVKFSTCPGTSKWP